MRRVRILPIVLYAAISAGLPAADFLRGDVDGSGRVAVTDAIRILLHLFGGDAVAVPCADAADTDDSGTIDIADAIRLLSGLFQGGPAPAAPFPGCGEDPTEDGLACEEACPPLSVYFGKEFRADGLFFVIDRSGTMQDGGELGRARRETERLILALPPGLELSVIFSSATMTAFPTNGRPIESSEEGKASAVAFVKNTVSGIGSCDMPALLGSIDFARNSRGRSPAVFYITDGGGGCMGAQQSDYHRILTETVTAANAGLARIHTFQVDPGYELQDRFLEDLALRNGGTYTPLPPP